MTAFLDPTFVTEIETQIRQRVAECGESHESSPTVECSHDSVSPK